MDIEQTIREYLPNVLHMSLATSRGDKPWICEVHFVYDDELNIYWRSRPNSRHSLDIASNPHVAGNIVEQHPLDRKPRGVYFEGTASIVDDIRQNSPIYYAFVNRIGASPDLLEDAQKEDGHKIYKVTVTDWYLFDSRESSPSQKYHLGRNSGND